PADPGGVRARYGPRLVGRRPICARRPADPGGVRARYGPRLVGRRPICAFRPAGCGATTSLLVNRRKWAPHVATSWLSPRRARTPTARRAGQRVTRARPTVGIVIILLRFLTSQCHGNVRADTADKVL